MGELSPSTGSSSPGFSCLRVNTPGHLTGTEQFEDRGNRKEAIYSSTDRDYDSSDKKTRQVSLIFLCRVGIKCVYDELKRQLSTKWY